MRASSLCHPPDSFGWAARPAAFSFLRAYRMLSTRGGSAMSKANVLRDGPVVPRPAQAQRSLDIAGCEGQVYDGSTSLTNG